MRIGVDLGGTKIEAIAMADDGQIVVRQRIESARDYDGCVRAIVALVRETEAHCGGTGAPVGIGMPGSLNPKTGLVRNANSTFLNGKPFGRDVTAALNRPVRLANDANCFALSEAVDGAGAGAASVFGVILGTGCGGGLVVNQELVGGAHGIAGEWGHTPLPWMSAEEFPGPSCWCGKQGCMETFVSGPAFLADAARSGAVFAHGSAVVAAAERGDGPAIAALNRLMDRLALGLAGVINLVDPEVIVLGGGLSNIPNLARGVQARLARYVFCDDLATRVVNNRHGDSSGVRGAAWLWPVAAR